MSSGVWMLPREGGSPVDWPAVPSAPLRSTKGKRQTVVPARRASRRSVKKWQRGPVPFKIEVYMEPYEPEVDAFVLLTKSNK